MDLLIPVNRLASWRLLHSGLAPAATISSLRTCRQRATLTDFSESIDSPAFFVFSASSGFYAFSEILCVFCRGMSFISELEFRFSAVLSPQSLKFVFEFLKTRAISIYFNLWNVEVSSFFFLLQCDQSVQQRIKLSTPSCVEFSQSFWPVAVSLPFLSASLSTVTTCDVETTEEEPTKILDAFRVNFFKNRPDFEKLIAINYKKIGVNIKINILTDLTKVRGAKENLLWIATERKNPKV